MGLKTTLYTIDPRNELFAETRSDTELADFAAFLSSFYQTSPVGTPPSWWYQHGDEPALRRFASLTASMLLDAPRVSECYLELDKDGFWFERHFARLTRSSEDAELVRVMLHGERRLVYADTKGSMDGSVRFTEASRCTMVAAWLSSLSNERLSEAVEGENDPDPDYASWMLERLCWAREQLKTLYSAAARTGVFQDSWSVDLRGVA